MRKGGTQVNNQKKAPVELTKAEIAAVAGGREKQTEAQTGVRG
jgi:hypothetical protein